MAFSLDSLPIVKQLKEKQKNGSLTTQEQSLLTLMQQQYDSLKDISDKQKTLLQQIAVLEVKKDQNSATEQELAQLSTLTTKLQELKAASSNSSSQALRLLSDQLQKAATEKRIQELKKYASPDTKGLQQINPDNYRDFLLATIGINPYQRDTAANDIMRDILLVIDKDMGTAKHKINTIAKKTAAIAANN